MSRGSESIANEERFFAEAVGVVKSKGFRKVVPRKSGAAKFIDAECANGDRVSFWLKLGWATVSYGAIQFAVFAGKTASNKKSNADFVDFVRARVESIKKRGATHALLAHRDDFNVAVRIDEITSVYAEQIRRFPAPARNGQSPTLWFFDPRPNANEELTSIVTQRAIPLEILSKRANANPEEPEARSRIAEIEARVAQAVFRNRVGERCGWRCVVTGSKIREVLDAAHLPGTDWRKHNQAADGILLRSDIHRLLGSGLVRIDNGRFRVGKAAKAEYGQYDNCAVL